MEIKDKTYFFLGIWYFYLFLLDSLILLCTVIDHQRGDFLSIIFIALCMTLSSLCLTLAFTNA